MTKPKTYWCGFACGRPAIQETSSNIDSECGVWPQLFKSKKFALEFYNDVRKVQIVEVGK